MIQELLAEGTALILGLITLALGLGNMPEEEVAVLPPPMPALETWNPGVHPPTIEEVIYDLLQGAADTIATGTPPVVPPPTTTRPPAVRPTPTTPIGPIVVPVIPPTPVDEPLPPPPSPTTTTSATTLLKGALVNIICTPAKSTGLRGTSGTGVIIDSRGIIVTVAHVGQYFLLEDYPEKNAGTCIIRTGSPAKNAYTAELIYISSSWIKENPDTIGSANPRGTGEHDFAFLAITGSLTGGPVPSFFVAARPAPSEKPAEGDKVSIGSYGAEFLSSSEIRSSLYPTITFGEIKEAYTFSDRGVIDIFSVQAGAAAQQGSSGGGVLNANNRFLGLITTRTVRADLSLRDLQALTIDHLRRSFRTETGSDLDSFLSGSVSALVSAYEDDKARLLKDIEDALN